MHKNDSALGIYIHIPFCIRKCNYCDFCSFPHSGSDVMERYVYELCKRIKKASLQTHERLVDTVYFGGGTPTLLPPACFERLMQVLSDSFRIDGNAEITCECNPATIDGEGLAFLRELGINRLSIGLQSANNEELKLLGRLHSFEDFKRTFADARQAGFDNISADLMYGIPKQTSESFRSTLTSLASLSPEHISAYGLKIEDGTYFAKVAHTLPLPDEDEEYGMYLDTCEILGNLGYNRYEISNFAKKGFESRHNLKYWNSEEYLGFGVAAHSFFGGERFGNSRHITAFLNGEDITEERHALSESEELSEYVMLRLRLAEGLDRESFRLRFGKDFDTEFPQTKAYVQNGFMKNNGSSIVFTSKGFFVSNTILSDMLDFGE